MSGYERGLAGITLQHCLYILVHQASVVSVDGEFSETRFVKFLHLPDYFSVASSAKHKRLHVICTCQDVYAFT